MDDFLEQFDKVSTSQKGLLLILVLAGVFVAFYLLLYSPLDQQGAQNEARVSELHGQVAGFQAGQGDVERLRQAISELCARQAEYEEALPSESNVAQVLDTISDYVRLANLELHLFRPGAHRPTADGYSVAPVELTVTGKFVELLTFFEFLARHDRVMNVTAVEFSIGGGPSEGAPPANLEVSPPARMEASLAVETYYYPLGSRGQDATTCAGAEGGS